MPNVAIQAPLSLLVDSELTAAARVLWLAMRTAESVSPAGLAAASGLTLPTIRKGLAQLEATGWYAPSTGAVQPASSAKTVSIPAGLLAQRRLRPQAKLLYGILQALPGFRGRAGEFTHATLSAAARVSLVTVRQAAQELAQAGWIQLSREHQLAPFRFTLRSPELERRSLEVAQANRRLEDARFRGEAIMQEFLSLLIDSDEFQENARPGFLVNPLTDERMELDRYYPTVLAFEYNGAQHYRTTTRFPSQQALATQQARDLMKEALCARRGIQFVVITRADLTLAAMQQKVGTLLPLRDLSGHEDLIQLLEKAGRTHHA